MKKIDDRLLSAYIDNELSVTEVEELEEQLSSDELQHLINERKLESSLSNVLKDTAKCPDVLWQSIIEEVKAEQPVVKQRQTPIIFGVMLAAAASILIYFAIIPGNYPVWVPKSVAELTQKSQVKVDRASVNSFIASRGVKLKLDDYPKTHHGRALNLLGAAIEKMAGDEVVALYFDCCGQPAKVFLIPNGSSAQEFIRTQDEIGVDGIVANRAKGDYQVTLVSSHNASELIDSIIEI